MNKVKASGGISKKAPIAKDFGLIIKNQTLMA